MDEWSEKQEVICVEIEKNSILRMKMKSWKYEKGNNWDDQNWENEKLTEWKIERMESVRNRKIWPEKMR